MLKYLLVRVNQDIDVYATIIFGSDAYGTTRISGEAMKNIVKPLGSAGTADPLDQRATWLESYFRSQNP